METPDSVYVNIMYAPRSNAEGAFVDAIETVDAPGVSTVITRVQMVGQASGLKVMVTYLAIYIGLVLLVATAAVLAIQLLSLAIACSRNSDATRPCSPARSSSRS